MSGHGFLLANYVPGNSLLHRAPLWLKFLLVLGCGMASFLIVDWAVAAGVLALMCALFLLSGAGFPRLFRAVEERLHAARPQLRVHLLRVAPVVGAVRLARRAAVG